MGKTPNKEGTEGDQKEGRGGPSPPESRKLTSSQLTQPTPIRQQFGRIVRKIRKMRGRSIYWLANEAGVDAGYISRLENARRNPPSPKILQRFADALDVKVDLLMMAAGYLKYDLTTEEPLNEEKIMIKVETALQKSETDIKSQNPEELSSREEETFVLPLIKWGDKCVGSTEDGDIIKGAAILLIQPEEGQTIQVLEILHRVGET